MNTPRFKTDVQAAFAIFVHWKCPHVCWIAQRLKAFTTLFLQKMLQPSVQYHMTFLLATILTFLLGWVLFGSTLPHLSPLAFLGYV